MYRLLLSIRIFVFIAFNSNDAFFGLLISFNKKVFKLLLSSNKYSPSSDISKSAKLTLCELLKIVKISL